MTIFPLDDRITAMKEIDFLDFYALVTLSVLTALSLLLLIRIAIINKKKAREVSRPFVLLTYSSLVSALIISIGAAASIVFKSYFILNIGLLAVVVVFAVYITLSENIYLRNQIEKIKRDKANAYYIKELKNLPSEEYLRARKTINTARLMIQKINKLIVGKKDISSDMFTYLAESFLTDLSADGAVVLAVQSFEEVLAVKALAGTFPPPYKLPDDLAHKEDHVFSNFKHAQFEMGESIFAEAVSEGKPFLIKNGKDNPLLPNNGHEKFLQHLFYNTFTDDPFCRRTAIPTHNKRPCADRLSRHLPPAKALIPSFKDIGDIGIHSPYPLFATS